jgi:uncharacterized SAM-binding protein YcdF (DUF218 family)
MAEYLIARGMNPEVILKDTASMDTIGNAYMSLCMHAIPRGWKKARAATRPPVGSQPGRFCR